MTPEQVRLLKDLEEIIRKHEWEAGIVEAASPIWRDLAWVFIALVVLVNILAPVSPQ